MDDLSLYPLYLIIPPIPVKLTCCRFRIATLRMTDISRKTLVSLLFFVKLNQNAEKYFDRRSWKVFVIFWVYNMHSSVLTVNIFCVFLCVL